MEKEDLLLLLNSFNSLTSTHLSRQPDVSICEAWSCKTYQIVERWCKTGFCPMDLHNCFLDGRSN